MVVTLAFGAKRYWITDHGALNDQREQGESVTRARLASFSRVVAGACSSVTESVSCH